MAGSERLRLFCALRLQEEHRELLARWAARELHGGRLVPEANLHVTLAFLGTRPVDDLPAIAAALRDAAAGASGIQLLLGAYRETRSVGLLALEDKGGLATALAGRLHASLEELGVYRRERRPWLPHVTVLRFRERPGCRPPLPGLERLSPSDAAVYMSRLRPGGAHYDVRESVPLGG